MWPRNYPEDKGERAEYILIIGGVSGVNLTQVSLHKNGEVLFSFWEVTSSFP